MTGLDTVGAVIKYRCCLRGDKIYTPEKTSRNSMPSATFVPHSSGGWQVQADQDSGRSGV